MIPPTPTQTICIFFKLHDWFKSYGNDDWGFGKWVDFARGLYLARRGPVTKGATPSSFLRNCSGARALRPTFLKHHKICQCSQIVQNCSCIHAGKEYTLLRVHWPCRLINGDLYLSPVFRCTARLDGAAKQLTHVNKLHINTHHTHPPMLLCISKHIHLNNKTTT